VRIAEEMGVAVEIIIYQKTPPDRDELAWLVAHLEDPPADLVRKDSQFKKLGLEAADYETPEQVVDIIAKHKMLMQRPVVVRGDRVIIGRPKDRVRELLTG
jgi:arsenate reductase (glutaredoxin)